MKDKQASWNEDSGSAKSANQKATLALMESHTDIDSKTVEWTHLMMLTHKTNAGDNLPWKEAMNGLNKSLATGRHACKRWGGSQLT